LQQNVIRCPECGSQRSYKDGIRHTRNGGISARVTYDVTAATGFHKCRGLDLNPRFSGDVSRDPFFLFCTLAAKSGICRNLKQQISFLS